MPSCHSRRVVLLVLTALASPAWSRAQAADPVLAIGGDVATPLTLGVGELRAMPRKAVEVSEEGRTLRYEGVLLGELLTQAGASLGADLRGDVVASYVVASAADGYRVVYSLAEVDPAFTTNDIIVADTVDGKPLFASQGPVRIVAPRDARAARSIRMLRRIDVVRLAK